MSAATAEPEAMVEGAAHAEEGFDAGATIMHHILDSNEVEIPFGGGATISLPHIEWWGIDISITRTVVMMWIASVIVLVIMLLAARRAKDPVPRGLRAAIEVLILFIRDDIARRAIDKHPDRYLGYLLTTFFFILSCNLLGLVPGMSTATGSISVTAALAVMAFVMIQGAGIREYGLVGHLKNLVPPGLPAPVVALIVPVEIIGMFAKPFALCIRLFANMTAGHVVELHQSDLHPEERVGGHDLRSVRAVHRSSGAADRVHPGLHLHDVDRVVHRHVRPPGALTGEFEWKIKGGKRKWNQRVLRSWEAASAPAWPSSALAWASADWRPAPWKASLGSRSRRPRSRRR